MRERQGAGRADGGNPLAIEVDVKHYPHHISDFSHATRHLNRIERSIYRDLIELYYETETQLPLDLVWICRKVLAHSNEESTAVEQALKEFFTETPTGYYHARCEEEIEAYRANTSQRAIAGKASAEAKRLKKLRAVNGTATPVEHPLNSVATVDNGASTNQSTNQPINQEPIVNTKGKAASPPFVLPDWVNAKHWDTWHSCQKRKKATPDQKQMAIDKLAAWRASGLDFAGALENAAIGGNQGLFLPSGFSAKQAQKPTGKHAGFDQLNYREGVHEDGALA